MSIKNLKQVFKVICQKTVSRKIMTLAHLSEHWSVTCNLNVMPFPLQKVPLLVGDLDPI